MPNMVYLSNLDDLDEVVRAFQQALDAVLSPITIGRLVDEALHRQAYQHVHPSATQSAVGCVSALLGVPGKQGQYGSLIVEIYEPGHHGGQNAVYVPARFASRLAVSLPGTAVTERVRRIRINRTYLAHVRLPLQTFRDHPHGVITVQAP